MFEVVLAGVCALDQRLLAKRKTFAIFSQWSREQRAESVSSLPSEKEKVKNEEGKVIKTKPEESNHRAPWRLLLHQTTSNGSSSSIFY